MLEFACLTRKLGQPEDIALDARQGQDAGARLMPRLRQIPSAEVTSETVLRYYNLLFGERDPVAEPGTATGTPGDWWTRVRQLAGRVRPRGARLRALPRPERKLDPVLRELGQTRVGWATGSQFVFSQHCKSLRGLKVSEEQHRRHPGLAGGRLLLDEERAVLAYADCLAARRAHAGRRCSTR